MPNQERGEEQLSVKDMPLVDQYLQCALPVLFIDAEHPAYPGIGGTCFVVRYRDRTLLLTAEHVVRGAAAESIKVPARFQHLA